MKLHELFRQTIPSLSKSASHRLQRRVVGQGDSSHLLASIAEAREITREVHAAVKDARAARKEAQTLADDYIDELKETLRQQVDTELQSLGEQTKKAMDKSVDRVQASFDELSGILLGTGDGEGPPLEEMIVDLRAEIVARHRRRTGQ